ncbi:polynucleotide 5'-hydroxyl-kinase nol9 [Anticarsia gemmatalis]|uniref:polynucleotide 5'-hydroxyl-kinase nol9 n=1 Tax=Anticarsia gemmatalis TaxID=129554 RepID=UPI003F759710
MEFFEKAHVSKKSPPKNDTKSVEKMKKNLKQMLHGYKKNDNDLIRTSGEMFEDVSEVHTIHDDSTSVSGFSDLDLTKSDDEEEIPADVATEIGGDISSSSEDNIISLHSTEDTSQDVTDRVEQDLEHTSDFLEPISEGDEDIESFSDDLEDRTKPSTSGGFLSSDFEDTTSLSTISDSGSETFDADGLLASKIMEKLGKSPDKSSPVCKKRKLNQAQTSDSKNELSQIKVAKNKKVDKKAYTDDSPIEIVNLKINESDDEILEKSDSNTQDSVSTNVSSPFIEIKATDMPDQSLSDIIGCYKHSTIKKIPSEKQNIVISGNNSSLFSVDDEMQVEDTDSLVPELGDDTIDKDLEIDLDATADSEFLENKENVDVEESEPQIESNDNEISSHTSENTHSVKVYHGNDSCIIIILKHPAKLYIHGKVKIAPLAGTVEVFGHTLREAVNLYAPNNSFAQCLKTVECDNEYYGLFKKLSAYLAVSLTEEIVTSLGKYDGVICLSPLKDRKMEFTDNLYPFHLFTKVTSDSTVNGLSEAANKLSCSLYVNKPARSFEESFEWNEAVGCGVKPLSRGIVCGGKGLGKSTFLRYYINRLERKGPLLVIDLDPGQAEFTVAGNISATIINEPLIGPNFTHLRTPDISYNVGMINTMDNTFRYAQAIAKLIGECRAKYPTMPWIVNTMGMTNHMGLKFLLLTIIHTQPTFLVQIDAKVMKKRFEVPLHPDAIRVLYDNNKYDRLFKGIELPDDLDYNFILTKHVEGSNKHDTSQSPKDERYLSFIAYFGELMNTYDNFLGIIPYSINLSSDVNIVTNVAVPREAVLKVINGKIVALCQLATIDKGKVFILQDNAPLCHGHGLVRGVDLENNMVYMLTPVAAERLRDVNTLMYLDWTPELQGTEQQLPTHLPVPYRGAAHHSHKQHLIAPRRRFNPLQLLKMSRSA